MNIAQKLRFSTSLDKASEVVIYSTSVADEQDNHCLPFAIYLVDCPVIANSNPPELGWVKSLSFCFRGISQFS